MRRRQNLWTRPLKGLGWMDKVGEFWGPWLLMRICMGLAFLLHLLCVAGIAMPAKGCAR